MAVYAQRELFVCKELMLAETALEKLASHTSELRSRHVVGCIEYRGHSAKKKKTLFSHGILT